MTNDAVLRAMDGSKYRVGVVNSKVKIGRYGNKDYFVPFYDSRAIEYIAGEARAMVKKGFDVCILYTGKRRTGKSTLQTQIAKAIDPEFPLECLSFKLADYDRNISELPYADPKNGVFPQVSLDEAGFDLFAQEWYSSFHKLMVKKMEVIAMKNLVLHMVLPHRKKLNKSIREEMVHYWIHTKTTQSGKRGIAQLRTPSDNIWDEKLFWDARMQFRFSKSEGPFWDAYLEKKRAFIDEVAAGQYGESKINRIKKVEEQRDTIIREYYQYAKDPGGKVTQDHLAELLGLTSQRVQQIVNNPTVKSPR